MIALDLSRPNYQFFLIIYLKFTTKSAEFVKREKLNQYAILSGVKNNKMHYKCSRYKKGQLKPINRLIKKFSNIHKFFNGDINELVLLVRKSVYRYEYIDSWERFVKTLPDKKSFYIKLYVEDITEKHYTHVQEVFEEFKLKNLGYYHDSYDQIDTLLLVDILENFRNNCIEIYELDPAHFLLCTWISMASLFKKDRSRIRISNRY